MRPFVAIALLLVAAGCGKGEKREPQAKDTPPAPRDPAPKTPQPSSEPLRIAVGSCFAPDESAASRPRDALLSGIAFTVRRESAALAECYRAVLATSPDRFGAVTVKFSADPTRTPSGVTVEGFGDPALESCVAKHISSLTMPTTEAATPVACMIAFGLAPVRVLADAGPKLEIAAGELRVDGGAPSKLDKLDAPLPELRKVLAERVAAVQPIKIASIRAVDDVPTEHVLYVIAEAKAAGVSHIGFESQREGKWAYAYLPLLPAAVPDGPLRPPVIAVHIQASGFRVGDTAGKRWQIDGGTGARNFNMLADVLRGRRRSPVHLGRDDIELSAEPATPYRDLADTMNIISVHKFSDIRLVDPAHQTVSLAASPEGKKPEGKPERKPR